MKSVCSKQDDFLIKGRKSRWMMKQRWENLLFMHFPMPINKLKSHLPPMLQIDTYDGTAWISIIPFEVSSIKIRNVPSLPFFKPFPQVNVRTYVIYKGVPGVYFFTLDTNHLLSVLGAKVFFHLPFRSAYMRIHAKQNDIHFQSLVAKAEKSEALHVVYRPTSEPFYSELGSIEYWFTERYHFFTERNGKIYKGVIQHPKWRLQLATAELCHNSMAPYLSPYHLLKPSILHFAKEKQAYMWSLQQC